MVCLGNKQRLFCCFWDCIQVPLLDSFFDYDGYSISSKGFLLTVVVRYSDIMVIWIKFTIPIPFSSLIPKMFEVPFYYLRFDHFQFAFFHGSDISISYVILLFTASDLASITSHINSWVLFYFVFIPFFFLDLFLHWSPVAYWDQPTRVDPLSVSYHVAFSYCSWDSQGKNTEVVSHSLLHGPHSVRLLHHDPPILGGTTKHGLLPFSSVGQGYIPWEKIG